MRLAGLVLLAAVLGYLLRRWERGYEFWHGPHYRRQVEQWAARDATIGAMPLPAIQPLAGKVVGKRTRPNRVARFQRRLEQ